MCLEFGIHEFRPRSISQARLRLMAWPLIHVRMCVAGTVAFNGVAVSFHPPAGGPWPVKFTISSFYSLCNVLGALTFSRNAAYWARLH